MTNFEALFAKSATGKVVYDTKELVLLDKIQVGKEQKIKVVFKEVNSDWRQAIVLETKGFLLIEGKKIKNSIILWNDTAPVEVDINVQSKNNELIVYNAWDVGNGVVHYWHNGAAMWVNRIAINKMEYHCNDGYPDVDLNDLIFTIELNDETSK